MKKISVIIPLLNEEGNLKELYKELLEVFKGLTYFDSYEIVAVNDGSTDNSLNILKNLASQDKNFKIVSFIRNFGHESATSAGIASATGDAVVLIDADRQDPPELIIEFEKEFLNGFDIVYGQRKKRLKESFLKKITSKAFYPIFKYLTKVDMPRNVGDFCLLSKKAVNIINNLPEKCRFVRGLIYWTGLPKKAVFFIRRSRGAGATKYNYTKLTIFALENIISFSTTPIYCIIFFSLFTVFGCIIGGVTVLIMKLLGFVIMTGWASLMLCILFFFSLILFFLGILGLYIGKIFQEIKNRPNFLIDEKINFD
ncbi:glycosyltransferase family 2 protein [Candidatus Babeliales bacterium]|nr:glycosyltransferase family 2 protein [Candidatus Babeliales bacterium]MCF7899127.1 glycosyltransferase family 2 protein [Candidatus Babeliales bacterium]